MIWRIDLDGTSVHVCDDHLDQLWDGGIQEKAFQAIFKVCDYCRAELLNPGVKVKIPYQDKITKR